MSSFNFEKPLWFKHLPFYFQPENSTVHKLEKFRDSNSIDDNSFAMMISMTPWSVGKLQLFMLEKFKKENTHLSQKELWRAVIQSRMNVKILTLKAPIPFFVTPLTIDQINSIINNLDNIVNGFKTFDEVIVYLVDIDKKEGWLTDPSGMTEEINHLLENN